MAYVDRLTDDYQSGTKCDRCGTSEAGVTKYEEDKRGWAFHDDFDFCPECALDHLLFMAGRNVPARHPRRSSIR